MDFHMVSEMEEKGLMGPESFLWKQATLHFGDGVSDD